MGIWIPTIRIPKTFEYWAFWSSDFKWFDIQMVCLWTRPTIQIPNQYINIRKQVVIHLFSIQMVGLSDNQMHQNTRTFGVQPPFVHSYTELVQYSDPHCISSKLRLFRTYANDIYKKQTETIIKFSISFPPSPKQLKIHQKSMSDCLK